ncbi:MAG: holo-[acyl-carrier protein] synthase [Acidobacteriota bacterium]|nr:holo-[acyl-carrier protein] synthase [Acidobacteriota bacterium]
MIKGTGIDIIDIPRIKKKTTEDPRFIEKLFTETEIAYCESKFRKEIHYAARFAAKEAFFKAMGTGWRDGMKWTDISIENNDLGKPSIKLQGKTLENFKEKNFENIHLSISHTREYAVAFVIIE